MDVAGRRGSHALARWRAYQPRITNPEYRARRENTVDLPLRRAGFPEE
jgi:hypothetical protein